MKSKIKIKDKGELKDRLYHETYDKIDFFADGSWTVSTTGTRNPGVQVSIKRNFFYNQSRRSINEEVKRIERLLNDEEDC